MAEQKAKHVIPKRHLYRAIFNQGTWVQCCYNYERMIGMACGHTFMPVIDDLYKNGPDRVVKRKEVMRREMKFFNVHIKLGSCILGMAIVLEEQKSLGEPIPGEFITSLKTSLMGPPAGIGGMVCQEVLTPILLAICIDIALTGTVQGAIVYLILILAISYILNFTNFFFGYQQGSEAIVDFLEKGLLDKLSLGVQVIGCMIMGGLIASYVKVSCGLEFVTSEPKFNVQTQLFDVAMPGILPFGFTMLVYWPMKKRWTSIKIIIPIVVIGIIDGLTGILAQQLT